MKSTTKRIELDWAKLMGFNQVKSTKGKAQCLAMVGAKIGVKVGVKPASVES